MYNAHRGPVFRLFIPPVIFSALCSRYCGFDAGKKRLYETRKKNFI